MSVPLPVQNVIKDDEEVLFVGQYSLANRVIKIVNDVNGELSLFTSSIPLMMFVNKTSVLIVFFAI